MCRTVFQVLISTMSLSQVEYRSTRLILSRTANKTYAISCQEIGYSITRVWKGKNKHLFYLDIYLPASI
jgi:hypothetical protein